MYAFNKSAPTSKTTYDIYHYIDSYHFDNSSLDAGREALPKYPKTKG